MKIDQRFYYRFKDIRNEHDVHNLTVLDRNSGPVLVRLSEVRLRH